MMPPQVGLSLAEAGVELVRAGVASTKLTPKTIGGDPAAMDHPGHCGASDSGGPMGGRPPSARHPRRRAGWVSDDLLPCLEIASQPTWWWCGGVSSPANSPASSMDLACR